MFGLQRARQLAGLGSGTNSRGCLLSQNSNEAPFDLHFSANTSSYESSSTLVGPLNDETVASLKNAFASIFKRPDSSLSIISATSLPSSPTSPSFSDVNPDDLFWISLPDIELDEVKMDDDIEVLVEIVSCETGDDGEVVVEIISCESDNDDDVVFLKEVTRSISKRE